MLIEIFGVKTVGKRLYSDAKLVGLQPSTKKYKDVAPVAVTKEERVDSNTSSEPFPNVKNTDLRSLDYIGVVQDISSRLKLQRSYPVDLAEIDRQFGELKGVGEMSRTESDVVPQGNGEEMTTSEKIPSTPSMEVKEALGKVRSYRTSKDL